MDQAKTETRNPNVTDPIELDEPLKRGEQTIDSITLRKPKSGELRGVSLADVLQMQTDALITLIPRLSSPRLPLPKYARWTRRILCSAAVKSPVFC